MSSVLPVPEGPCGREKAAFPFPPCPLIVFMGQGQVESEDQGCCSDSEYRLPAFSVSAPIRGPGLLDGKEGEWLPRPLIRDSFSKRDTGLKPASSALSVPDTL